jgi:hypothetical protein
MGNKKILKYVLMFVIFLLAMGITVSVFPAQKTTTQQAPLKAVSTPVRITARVGVSPASYSGNCPALITFKGHITVNQPTTVQYRFIRSDNASAPVQTLHFPKAGTQEVSTTWQLGGPGLPTYSGWEAIEVISPISVQSNKANFRIRCAIPGKPEQQSGPAAQPGQQGIPIDIKAKLSAKPVSYTGNCPALISFGGYIAVNQPMTVQYRFIRSDNASAPVRTLHFASKSRQMVTTTWQLGGPGLPTYSGWEAIEVISPVNVKSNKADFRVRCTGQGQQGGAEQEGQLPDLTIVDITLNDQCFVVVTARNDGSGRLPDKVWTDHSPDSSAIYLYVNGKKWGGETIWHFDPDKNLQKPGGAATMTSNLKVTGTATITAVIDHTRKVKETDEKNNVMKKEVTCRATTAIQHGVVAQPGTIAKPEPSVQPAVGAEDCVSFNPATTTVQQIQGSWKVVDGSHWMFDFGPKQDEAKSTFAIIKHYRMSRSCFVGRPQPSFQYMLVGGNAPAGSFAGEDCVSFNPVTATVQQIQGRWKIVDGSHWMFDFGNKENEARQALAIIKKYGFTRSCFVGRPGPSFSYLRK